MAAAWEVNPRQPKPQPAAIPPEVFAAQAVVRGEAGPPSGPGDHGLPDFRVELTGFVPLPDNPVPLVGTRFADRSSRGLSGGAKVAWDFGDGQSSDVSNPAHVYLRPGLYTVRLSVRRGSGKPLEATSRVEIAQPRLIDASKLPRLDDYLPDLQTFNTRTLPTNSARAVGRGLSWPRPTPIWRWRKSPRAKPTPSRSRRSGRAARPRRNRGRSRVGSRRAKRPPARRLGRRPRRPRQAAVQGRARRTGAKCFQIAVDGGKVAFLEDTAAAGEDGLLHLARLIAPMRAIGSASRIWPGPFGRVPRNGSLRRKPAPNA